MKYMIMLYASQQDDDQMMGKPTDQPTWSSDDVAAMHAFRGAWTRS